MPVDKATGKGEGVPLHDFFRAVLPVHKGLRYFLWQKGTKKDTRCDGTDDLIGTARQWWGEPDIYFSTASFRSDAPSRKGENAFSVKCFKADFDAGKVDGEGNPKPDCYATLEEAFESWATFEQDTGFEPSFIVRSGNGLHVYWALREDMEPDDWKPIARRFEDAMLARGLLPDKTVTKDAVRLLRVPGTIHSGTGRAVTIVRATGRVWELEEFKRKVDQFAPPEKARKKAQVHTASEVGGLTAEQVGALRSALPWIDCKDYGNWVNVGLALKTIPDDGGLSLWIEWSSGYADFDEDEAHAKWESFAPTGTHWKWVFTKAQELGWSNPGGSGGGDTCDWIEDMNLRYAYCTGDRRVYRVKEGDFITGADLREIEGKWHVEVKAGEGTKTVQRGAAWLRHPKRRDIPGVRTVPGDGGAVVKLDDAWVNDWQGYSVAPWPDAVTDDDVRPYLDLTERLFGGNKEYPLRWTAHLLQYPGTKMMTALVLHSDEKGIGKNLWAEIPLRIIGKRHSRKLDMGDLHSQFNDWAHRKVYVLGDEVSSTDRRADADRLKLLTTSDTLSMNAKFQPAREVPNLVNSVYLSNYNDALFFDAKERRFFVHGSDAGPMPDAEARAYCKWRDGDGLSKLLRWFLDFDLGDFNPHGRAPETESRAAMIEAGMSDLERWLHGIVSGDAGALIGREVATTEEVAQLYARCTDKAAPSTKAVGGALSRVGAKKRKTPIKIKGQRRQMFALGDVAHWLAAPEAQWLAEVTRFPVLEVPR